MKCCFCLKSGAQQNGFIKKLKPAYAHEPCAELYWKLKAGFGQGFSQSVSSAIDVERLSASAQQNALFSNDGYSTIRVGDKEWRVTAAGAGYRARLRLKDNLESCACTHKAKRHVEDGEGNLLHCRDCDCDHFWYAVPQVYNKDLVTLSADEISAEPTVLDKLRAVTRENGATPDEVITAQQKIITLLTRKEERIAA